MSSNRREFGFDDESVSKKLWRDILDYHNILIGYLSYRNAIDAQHHKLTG